MTSSVSEPRLSYASYLEAEARSEVRHEYLDGRVWAMAGGTPEHGALAMAVARDLGAALIDRPCRVFSSDVRLRVRATGLATYPDLSVVCEALETDPEDPDAIVNPVLLIEVLSDSTEAYDRGEKSAHYRRIPSLREYVLLSQHESHVEVYRRNEEQRWELYEHWAGDSVALASVGCELSVDALYRDPLTGPG